MQSKTSELTAVESSLGIRLNGNHFYVAGASPAMRTLERVIADIAPTDIPVLLVGESGTGKEVLAANIHRLSQRRDEPLVKLSCAGLTPESFNGRLHSTENGNEFNGNGQRGTLFLDEISELDSQCQPKLLHALPDGEGMQEGALGARVISATSRNLEEEMRAGRFREELYYRINGVCLRLPPLRHRKEDIPVLTEYFLTKYSALFGRPQRELSAQTMRALMEHSWPGNVRELESAVKKIVALGEGHIAVGDLLTVSLSAAPAAPVPAESVSLKQASRAASRQAERQLILKVLAKTRWNRKRAAQELQISYKALLYKLKQIGLDDSAVS